MQQKRPRATTRCVSGARAPVSARSQSLRPESTAVPASRRAPTATDRQAPSRDSSERRGRRRVRQAARTTTPPVAPPRGSSRSGSPASWPRMPCGPWPSRRAAHPAQRRPSAHRPAALHLFGRHVLQRPDDRALGGRGPRGCRQHRESLGCRAIRVLRKAEIEQLCAAGREHHVTRLQVAMDDAVPVSGLERIRDFDAEPEHLG